jgi:hypothetical protein
MENEKKTERIAIRIASSTKKALEKKSKANFRTVSQEVEMLILKHLKK